MTKQLAKNNFGWGFSLWLIGYVLGIALFPFVPTPLIGWAIMPVGIALTLWVLLKKVRPMSVRHSVLIATVWTLIAVICDYIFIVLLLKPADGYYKLDIYLYYALTFALPILVGWKNSADK